MRVVALSSLCILGGCTTQLATSPVPANLSAVAGIPYTLPALQYRGTVKRTLTDCVVEKDGSVKPEFDVTVEAVPAYVEGETYVADYRALSGLSKTMSVKIESFDNHTIKSVNAEADDKGPEIVAGVAKAGFTIARLALGLSSPADVGGGAPSKLTCPATLAQAKEVTAAIKARTTELTGLNAELEPYVVTALIATLTDDDKEKIKVLRGKIREANKALIDLREKLAEQEKVLSASETVDLDFSPGALDRQIAFPSTEPALKIAQEKWINQLFGGQVTKDELGKISAQMKPIVATLRRIGGAPATSAVCGSVGLPSCLAQTPKWDRDNQGRLPNAIPGIAYRQPVKARLRVCLDTPAKLCAEGGGSRIVEAEGWAPQIGMLVVLPFTNGFGVNNQLQAQFRADGSLEWASYADKRSVALASVNTLNEVLDGGLALSDAIAAKRKADADAAKADAAAAAAAPLTAAQNALALAKAESDLAALQAAMNPANQAVVRQQALLDARVAQLTSQVQEKELLAKLQP